MLGSESDNDDNLTPRQVTQLLKELSKKVDVIAASTAGRSGRKRVRYPSPTPSEPEEYMDNDTGGNEENTSGKKP
jgi:hypothetical protein